MQVNVSRNLRCLLVVCIVLVSSGARIATAEDAGADGAGAAAQASPAPTEEEGNDATLNSMFGKTVGSDYVAKHFSLIFGVVVLDPFNFTSPMPPMNGSEEEDDASNSVGSEQKQYFLQEGGETEVRAFLEGGVRYRWAWLDRIGVGVVPTGGERDRACPGTRAALKTDKEALRNAVIARTVAEETVADTEAALADAVSELTKDAPDRGRDLGAEITAQKKNLREQKKVLERKKEEEARLTAQVKADEAEAEKDTKRYYEREWQLSQEGVPVQILCSMWQRKGAIPSYCPEDASASATVVHRNQDGFPREDDWDLKWWGSRCFLPGDFQARVGYVFDGGSPAGLASLASSSNVYGDLIGGINLIRASMPTSSPDETPVRAAVNLEGLVSLTTDTNSVDVHGRYLVGAGFAVGVPLFLLPQQSSNQGGDDEKDEKDSSNEPSSPTLKPAGIVEMVARLGAVNIDVPSFKNRMTRELEVQNELPDFSGEWGLGLDLELNVPIAERAGYITARASINELITPAPWGVQLGYTIPLSTLVGLVTGGQNGE